MYKLTNTTNFEYNVFINSKYNDDTDNGIPCNKLTGLYNLDGIACPTQISTTPIQTLTFKYQLMKIVNSNIVSLFKNQIGEMGLCGFIMPLKLNNEFNEDHKYITINGNTKILFNQVDFKCSLEVSQLRRISPEQVDKTILSNIPPFNFREKFIVNNKMPHIIIDGPSIHIQNQVENILNIIDYSSISKNILYCEMSFGATQNIEQKYKNSTISGIVIFLTKKEIDVLLSNELYYLDENYQFMYPLDIQLKLEFFNNLGLGYNFNDLVNDFKYNLDFRNPIDNNSVSNSNLIFFTCNDTENLQQVNTFNVFELENSKPQIQIKNEIN